MGQFRILHISDLHFSRDYPEAINDSWPVLRYIKGAFRNNFITCMIGHSPLIADALAEFTFRFPELFDVILITGDISTTGSMDDLSFAREFMLAGRSTPIENLEQEPCLNILDKEIFVVPGNHDRFKADAKPGGRDFDKVFNDLWREHSAIQYRVFESRNDGTKLVMIGVDFSLVEGDGGDLFYGYLGRGRVTANIIEKLKAITNRARLLYEDDGVAVLWAIHFNPLVDTSQFLKLLKNELLLKAIEETNVSGVLCGHTHIAEYQEVLGTPVFVCGSTTQYQTNNELQILEIGVPEWRTDPITMKLERFRYGKTLVRDQDGRVSRIKGFYPHDISDPLGDAEDETDFLLDPR